jgi:hypothetical protein
VGFDLVAVEKLRTAKFIGSIMMSWSTVRDFCRGSFGNYAGFVRRSLW